MANPTVSTLLATLLAAGLPYVEEEATKLEALEPQANDAIVAGAVGAVVKALPSGGIGGLIDGGLKTAIVAAEPELESALGKTETDLIDAAEAYIKTAAAGV